MSITYQYQNYNQSLVLMSYGFTDISSILISTVIGTSGNKNYHFVL